MMSVFRFNNGRASIRNFGRVSSVDDDVGVWVYKKTASRASEQRARHERQSIKYMVSRELLVKVAPTTVALESAVKSVVFSRLGLKYILKPFNRLQGLFGVHFFEDSHALDIIQNRSKGQKQW